VFGRDRDWVCVCSAGTACISDASATSGYVGGPASVGWVCEHRVGLAIGLLGQEDFDAA